MNRQDNMEPLVTQQNDHSRGVARRAENALSLLEEPRTLSTRELEERSLIHRNDTVREHADAFRELRTRLLTLGGDRNFVTLVAPISHGCGGSFVARNLATAFALGSASIGYCVTHDRAVAL
jgi:hypothetical protein